MVATVAFLKRCNSHVRYSSVYLIRIVTCLLFVLLLSSNEMRQRLERQQLRNEILKNRTVGKSHCPPLAGLRACAKSATAADVYPGKKVTS